MTSVATPIRNSPADEIAWQQDLIARNEYELIGRAWVIVLEASKDAAVPQPSIAKALGCRLEFYGMSRVNGRDLMPRLAQSKDHSTLLLLDPIVNQEGKAGLPDIPDPTWTPPIPKPEEVAGVPGKNGRLKKGQGDWKPPAAPMMRQELGDRARGQVKGTRFLVFGPVVQIVIRPEGLPEGWIAQCGGETRSGLQMDLLIDQDTGHAFFYGGRFQISRVG